MFFIFINVEQKMAVDNRIILGQFPYFHNMFKKDLIMKFHFSASQPWLSEHAQQHI